jgi:predicted metal-dependent hydrolase
MTLRVAASGTRLTVPARASARQIDAFLRASEPWVAEQRGRLAPAPAPLRDGDRLAYLDDALDLRVVPAGGGRRGAAREGTRLVVATRAGEDPGAVIEGWYRREAARVIAPRARAAADALGVRAGRVTVRDPRSRWGSCSSTGTLSFSWRLLLAPEAVLDYVVAHEACHLLRPDHSPAFWALVAETFPGHAGARSWLRENGARLHRGPGWRREEGLSPS